MNIQNITLEIYEIQPHEFLIVKIHRDELVESMKNSHVYIVKI